MKTNHFFSLLFASFIMCCASCDSEQNTEESTTETTQKSSTIATEASHEESAAAEGADDTSEEGVGEFKFDNTEFDFGTINEGDVVKHVFKYTNTGKAPLVIKDAKGSCGCTVPNWSSKPVAPGESGEINVEFNSSHKSGAQHKTVTIMANTTPSNTGLVLKGTVTPKAETNGPVKK